MADIQHMTHVVFLVCWHGCYQFISS